MKVGHKSRPITVVSRINLTVDPPQTDNYTVRMYFCRLLRPTFMADFHGRLSWPTFMADFGRPTVAVFGRLAGRLLQPNRFGRPTLILKSATSPTNMSYQYVYVNFGEFCQISVKITPVWNDPHQKQPYKQKKAFWLFAIIFSMI